MHKKGLYHYILADEPAALAYLANLGAIEIHPWLSRCGRAEYPDWAVIDLDPAEGASWTDVRRVALLVRQVLEHQGIVALPKSSGATGLHIYCPCAPDHTYDDTAGFVEAIGRLLARADPGHVTMERMVAKRTGKVYVDYLQNRLGQTINGLGLGNVSGGVRAGYLAGGCSFADSRGEGVFLLSRRVKVDRAVRWGLRLWATMLEARLRRWAAAPGAVAKGAVGRTGSCGHGTVTWQVGFASRFRSDCFVQTRRNGRCDRKQ